MLKTKDHLNQSYVGLGANLPSAFGSPLETIQKAKEAMEKRGLKIIVTSPTYKTAPVPISDDPWYHNEVVEIMTNLSPSDLLKTLNSIEVDFGRIRSRKNAPRVLDLDILSYDDKIILSENLTIPHPRLAKRAFVLYPLRDIAPNWKHPESKKSVDELITDLEGDQIIEKI
jgi:2-amino-4-hydroxy-6-hydroxymethyldihydropteridine diphosphokinase